MRFLVLVLLLVCLVPSWGQESEDEPKDESWWVRFKQRVKTVLSKWREDVKLLWNDVLSKAEDMRGWTTDMFESFKRKLKEWLETRPEMPDDEKNEIETFINKLKVPIEESTKKSIDP